MAKVENDGFRIVSGRRKFKKRNQLAVIDISIEEEYDGPREETVLRKIEDIFRDTAFLHYFKQTQKLLHYAQGKANLESIGRILCLGIGSFASCPAALHQLALVLQIQKSLCIKKVDFYDPVLSKCEKQILEKLGWKLLSYNCEGRYRIENEILVFLPHCPKQLINNFLWENWDKRLLKKALLLCNSFSSLVNNTPQRLLRHDAEYIMRIAEYTKEYALENNYQLADAFNDTSIHSFLEEDLSELGSDFWYRNNLPIYEDVELITKELELQLKLGNNNKD